MASKCESGARGKQRSTSVTGLKTDGCPLLGVERTTAGRFSTSALTQAVCQRARAKNAQNYFLSSPFDCDCLCCSFPINVIETRFLRASYIGRHQQAASHPFCASEQYLGSTAWVPLAANASLSRYLICHPIFGLKFASRINFILSVTSWSPFGYLYWGIGHGNRTSAA